MGKWKKIKLGLLLEEVTLRNKANLELPVYSVTNSNGFIPSTDYFSKEVFSKNLSNYKIVKQGMFAYNPSRINVGSIAWLSRSSPVIVSPLYVVFKINENIIKQKYLWYFLRGNIGLSYINSLTSGSVRDSLKFSSLQRIVLGVPPLQEQELFIRTLDTATELLTMYKQQLAELDNLIKSIFYDMFGDPVANEKGWALKPIGDFSMVKIGPFGSLLHSEDYIEGGFPLVNPSHIIDGKIVPDMKLTLSTKKFKELKSYAMKKGDIVVGRRGEIGRCAIVDDEGFLCGTGSMYIRIKKDYLPMMLQRIISSETIRAKLEHQSVGVTMKNLNAGTISNLEIPMPPLPLQNQFVSIVTKIEEQKTLVKKAIDETQYLFDCLMNEYFE